MSAKCTEDSRIPPLGAFLGQDGRYAIRAETNRFGRAEKIRAPRGLVEVIGNFGRGGDSSGIFGDEVDRITLPFFFFCSMLTGSAINAPDRFTFFQRKTVRPPHEKICAARFKAIRVELDQTRIAWFEGQNKFWKRSGQGCGHRSSIRDDAGRDF